MRSDRKSRLPVCAAQRRRAHRRTQVRAKFAWQTRCGERVTSAGRSSPIQRLASPSDKHPAWSCKVISSSSRPIGVASATRSACWQPVSSRLLAHRQQAMREARTDRASKSKRVALGLPPGRPARRAAERPSPRSRRGASCRRLHRPAAHLGLRRGGFLAQSAVSTGQSGFPHADRRVQRHPEEPLPPLQHLQRRADALHAAHHLVGRGPARRRDARLSGLARLHPPAAHISPPSCGA